MATAGHVNQIGPNPIRRPNTLEVKCWWSNRDRQTHLILYMDERRRHQINSGPTIIDVSQSESNYELTKESNFLNQIK
ncbi:hypothetical protein BLOT_003545 [Blomia tropicalis]|nr:hypothetical protein BLOT_003545 [Blomia tropicalis]